MLSRTKVHERMKNKTNVFLAEAIFLAKKNKLNELAACLAVPTRKQAAVNIDQLKEIKGENVIVAGKVLSNGEINKKIKIYALSFSKRAEEKLKKAGCETIKILDALRKGEKIKGEIIR